MPHFRKAAKINPLDPVSNLNIAANEQEHGNLRQGVSLYQCRSCPCCDFLRRARRVHTLTNCVRYNRAGA